MQVPEGAWGRPLLEPAPGWRAGDRLRDDRGCRDGTTVSHLQRQRQVDVILPLQTQRLATQEARQRADVAAPGEAHPARADQPRALVRGVEQRWAECAVPLHACVIRFWHQKKKRPDPSVLVTTALQWRASWRVRH
jgi:hypothetical protein